MTRPRSPFRAQTRTGSAYRLVQNAATPTEAELMLYGEIAWYDIDAKQVVRDIRNLSVDVLHVRINSPGGSVFDGVTIFNALRDHSAKVITYVDAVAASIASLIALAGDEVRIADNAFFMIHNAWGVAIGNAAELRKTADLFDKVEEATIIRAYLARTGETEEVIRGWMSDETWFTAEEAVDAGFADAIDERAPVKALGDLSVFAKAPATLVASQTTTTDTPPATVREFESLLREKGGFSHAAARSIAAGGFRTTPPDPREEAESGSLQPLADLAGDIRSLLLSR
jgi:ATP-dependent Clp protease, protease subunit